MEELDREWESFSCSKDCLFYVVVSLETSGGGFHHLGLQGLYAVHHSEVVASYSAPFDRDIGHFIVLDVVAKEQEASQGAKAFRSAGVCL